MSVSTLAVLIGHKWLHFIFLKLSYQAFQFKYTFGLNSHLLWLHGGMDSLAKRHRILSKEELSTSG